MGFLQVEFRKEALTTDVDPKFCDGVVLSDSVRGQAMKSQTFVHCNNVKPDRAVTRGDYHCSRGIDIVLFRGPRQVLVRRLQARSSGLEQVTDR